MAETRLLMRKILYGRQGFTRAYPPPSHHRVDEDDLFADVRLD